VEAHALHNRSWTISAIARHLGRSRSTVRAYLTDQRTAGERGRAVPDPFDRLETYVAARLTEDPHVLGHDAVRRDP